MKAQLFNLSLGLLLIFIGGISFSSEIKAELWEADLKKSIVTVYALNGKQVADQGTGFVVQGDRYNGYVVTNARLLNKGDAYTVAVPDKNIKLVAQITRIDSSFDFAILKVNGLNLPALQFANGAPEMDAVLWSAMRLKEEQDSVALTKGRLLDAYELVVANIGVLSHNADSGKNDTGSVLLNDCGQVAGLDIKFEKSGSGSIAMSADSLIRILRQQNVRVNQADAKCETSVTIAVRKAEVAILAAQQARKQADEAEKTAANLEQKLSEVKRENKNLVAQVRQARIDADRALVVAATAQEEAARAKVEVETKTLAVSAKTEAMVAHLEQDRVDTEERYKQALIDQKQEYASRETTLLGAFVTFAIVLILIMFFVLRTIRLGQAHAGVQTASPARTNNPVVAGKKLPKSDVVNYTELRQPHQVEYVLDGRDEDGIQYMLRFSGKKLTNTDGIIIGRNPKDSPYIINHVDVSRKHARLKVMKDRMFIEDLGSTNGTSVNGETIEEKGLVSIGTGDQIVIGSVVMKLRVLNG